MTDEEYTKLIEALARKFSRYFQAHLKQPDLKHVEAAMHSRPCYIGSEKFFETLAAIAIRELKDNPYEV